MCQIEEIMHYDKSESFKIIRIYFTNVKFKIPTCEHQCFVFVFPHIVAQSLDHHACDRADLNHTMHEQIPQ